PVFGSVNFACIVFQAVFFGMVISEITGPEREPVRNCNVAPRLEAIIRFIFLGALVPKSTVLYCNQAPGEVNCAFQPLNLSVLSRKSTVTPLSLIMLYLSNCIFCKALLTPTPRKVGRTFLILPSGSKNRLSILTERFLSKCG